MEARFSAPVQTGPGAHPASCTKGTGSFPGVKSGRSVLSKKNPMTPKGTEPASSRLVSQCLNPLSHCATNIRYSDSRGPKFPATTFSTVVSNNWWASECHLLLLPLALQPTVGLSLPNNVLPFFLICQQLSPSSHSQHF